MKDIGDILLAPHGCRSAIRNDRTKKTPPIGTVRRNKVRMIAFSLTDGRQPAHADLFTTRHKPGRAVDSRRCGLNLPEDNDPENEADYRRKIQSQHKADYF
mgnify:CR=1 FL=1